MDKSNKGKMNMFILVALYFTKYSTLFTGYAQLILEITGFKGVIDDLGLDVGIQAKDTKGVTAEKNDLVLAAVKLTVDTSRKARVWAENEGEVKLEHTFNIHVTDFHHIDAKIVLEDLTIVSKAIGDNMAHFVGYKIVAADVTTIDAAIAAAMEDIGKPKQAIKERATSTGNIALTVDKGMVYLHKIDDLLISEYKDTNPKEVAEYKLNRQEEPIGVHHTGIRAIVTTGDGELVNEALVSIPLLKRSVHTNYDGGGELVKFKADTYLIEITKDGFEKYTCLQKTERAKMTVFTVKLVPKMLQVIVTKGGLPVREYCTSIVNTTIVNMTDIEGKSELWRAPNKGVIEISNENGEFKSVEYDMNELNKLVIHVQM